MKTILSAFVATLLLARPAVSGPCALPDLAWMAGAWVNATDPKAAQERWVVAPGDRLMGSAFEFTKSGTGYAEMMSVRPGGDGVVMVLRHFDAGLDHAWEDRAAPMVFKAANCEAGLAVFDGQGDHVGEHLTYRRTGSNLLITGDFLHHGTPDHEEWRMIRAAN